MREGGEEGPGHVQGAPDTADVGTEPQGGARRALVVDDEASIRELVRLALEDEGWDVREAPDGSAALRLVEGTGTGAGGSGAMGAGSVNAGGGAAAGWQPDVILLDMRMPVMDGWEFARRYGARPAPRAPIVCMTAAANAGAWADEIGAAGLLSKPFELDTLVDVVDRSART